MIAAAAPLGLRGTVDRVEGGESSNTSVRGDAHGAAFGRPVWACAICRHVLGRAIDGVAVNGSERHTFANPQGVVFQIRCLREAAGCRSHGAPSMEFTWFAGHAWTIELCAKCGVHVGWSFRSDRGGFYGLIEQRLVEANTGGEHD